MAVKRFIPLALGALLVAVPRISVAKGAAPKGQAKKKSRTARGVLSARKQRVAIPDQVGVRHRYELRKGRFEVGPSMAVTLDRTLMNSLLFGFRAQYHISDYLSVGTDWSLGANFLSATSWELAEAHEEAAAEEDKDKPSFDELAKGLSRLQAVGDIRLNFTPISGKIGIFSKLFMGYDLYAFAGLAFAKTTNATEDPQIDLTNDQFNVGLAWGVGFHVYATNWLSIGVEIRDLMFMDNETGRDITRGREEDEQRSCIETKRSVCRLIDGNDRQFLNHFFFGINATIFFPLSPKIAF